MTMTGDTETIDPGAPPQPSGLSQVIRAITNLIVPVNKELITVMRTPTPIKTTQVFQADLNGCIGGGLDTPNAVPLYQCPMSAEAWLHRITITCPDHGPAQPLTSGEAYCVGSTSGEILFFLPYHGDVAPIQIIEGRLSAPHLNGGEIAGFVADQLPPGTHLRIDLQLVLATGISDFTPRGSAPTNLNKALNSGIPGLD
jgi:hypothetical protein